MFKAFLNAPANEASPLLMKDVVALVLTENFAESSLSFGGVCLGWATFNHPVEHLQRWLNSLAAMTLKDSAETLSFELFIQEVEGGRIGLGGFYPLQELDAAILSVEYPQFSLLQNSQERDRLFNWAYRNILRGALQTDPSGALCSILAVDAELADLKIREAASLLQNYTDALKPG